MSSNDPAHDSATEIVRRKISLPRQNDEMLQALADEHYAGNCSRAVRCAIADHQRSLDESENTELERLIEQIETLKSKISEVVMQPRNGEGVSHHQQTTASEALSDVQGGLNNGQEMSDEMLEVSNLVLDVRPDALSIAELADTVEMTIGDLIVALGRLEDAGKIKCSTADGGVVRVTAEVDA